MLNLLFCRMAFTNCGLLNLVSGVFINSFVLYCTGSNRNTIKLHLAKLVKSGRLSQQGVGRGTWYTLDLDYALIFKTLLEAGFEGYVSIEMEGGEAAETAMPKSVKMLKAAWAEANNS